MGDNNIGRRIKSLSRERQEIQIRKRKKLEAASAMSKRQRRRRIVDTFSDIEEIVIPEDPVPDKNAQKTFEHYKETNLAENLSRSKNLNIEEPLTAQNYRKVFEQHKETHLEKNVSPPQNLNVEASMSEELVVITSGSEADNDENDEKGSDGSMSDEDQEDETSVGEEEEEEEEEEAEDTESTEDEDYKMVESESSKISSSSSLSSSSSSDNDRSLHQKNQTAEKIEDTEDGGRNVGSRSKKPVQTKRKFLGNTKRYKTDKKQKPQKEQKRVVKQQINTAFTCAHCGNTTSAVLDCDNFFTGTVAAEAAGEDLDKIASTNASGSKDSYFINSVKNSEIPTTAARGATEDDLNQFGPNIVARGEVSIGTKSKTPATASRTVDDDLNQFTPKHLARAEDSVDKTSKDLTTATNVAYEELNKYALTDVTRAKDYVSISNNNPPTATRAPDEDLNKLVSTNISRVDDSVFVGLDRKYGKQQSLNETYCSSKGKKSEAMESSRWRDVDVFGLLVSSVLGNQKIGVEEPHNPEEMESEDHYAADEFLVEKPSPLKLKLKFGEEEPEPDPEISESERENMRLFDEFALLLKSSEAEIEVSSNIAKESRADEHSLAGCEKGNHELYLDLEIGLKCIYCGFVETEIRDMDVEWGDMHTKERRRTERLEYEDKTLFEKLGFQALSKNSSIECVGASEGTVWDVIPGTKIQLYPHQQEGFEFIWRNLAGTIIRDKLKEFETSDKTGGCIISHAPGTGKTRLTIIFLQSYMKLFPNCSPMIIAPASLLLTWEEEFKKWNMDVPFHNLNNLEFSGKESSVAVNILEQRRQGSKIHNDIRMVKLYSWSKEKSILGISYSLFEKLAGDDVEKKKKKEVIMDKHREEIRKILLVKPGLLVLDEAHTPRSQRSCIWKTLTKVATQKRILLSGTPFQNNFLELCNVLCVARPAYLSMFSSILKNSKMTILKRRRVKDGIQSTSAVKINDSGIEELKNLMEPFVHVHNGTILQKNLPGLRDCVVVLNPPPLQKRVLEAISGAKNMFEVDHKRSVVSVHPSLISSCTLSDEESLVLDENLLDKLKNTRRDPNQSVKTRLLMEFIRLCDVINERVLVFSQYIDPLSLIMEQLGCIFNWSEGKEVFYLHGKLEQKQRQLVINKFNDPKSKAKVILASIRACSEGINLVGASRVILLDVVWNPAVERQAISRAYRIGQKRIVYTYHFVLKGSLECQKYCQQAEKHRIAELVFSSQHEKTKTKSFEVVSKDIVLDQLVQHMAHRDMFEKLIYQPKETDLVEGFNSILP